MDEKTELYHYGVLGMKWGVRRTPTQLDRRTNRTNRDPKKMSDTELNSKINRILKEKQYNDLTKSNTSKIGQRVVEGILIAGALEIGKNLYTGTLKDGSKMVGSILKEVGPVLLKNHTPKNIAKTISDAALAGNMLWEIEKDIARR